ncbi:MAG: biotin--[acetyl-CoA-carboxylase] ligase [Oscillospiraceae bacterium]
MTAKEQTLKLLQENKDKYISGNIIALRLGVTRACIWKAIKSLQNEGYIIDAVTNKGYSLQDDNDIITSQSIIPLLRTHDLGRNIEVFAELDSTNAYAKIKAVTIDSHGSVIIANEQTNGKGRLGRSFYSPKNTGIYMSVILKDKLSTLRVEQSLLITSAVAVAVTRAIQKVIGVKPQIKWVNDIYIEGKKVCGILTEASINFETGKFDYIVVGIGINVATQDFPQNICERATSLSQFVDKKNLRSKIIAAILNFLEPIIDNIENKDFIDEYKKKSLVLNRDIVIIKGGTKTLAHVEGIDDNCCLIVKTADQKLHTLNSGEVSVRLKD